MVTSCRNDCQHVSTMVATSKDGDGGGLCLSEDLIIEILSRLPVADLLRYRCVCKSWYSVISCSDFISKHLENYYQNDRSWHGCLLALYYVTQAELNMFELSIDETPKVLASESLENRPMYGSFICGPCDGIYYLFNGCDGERERALWNPVTNELKALPPVFTKPDLPSNLAYSICEAFGFGFDPLSKDYKVVVVKCYCSEDYELAETVTLPASVFVYSLRTDSWTYCGDLSQIYEFDMPSNQCYRFLDGSYYWLLSSGAKSENDCVISFDMTIDAYQEIHTPIYEKPASRSLAIYHNSVAYLSFHEIKKDLVIWMLNEEGLWTKKFTIGPLSGIRSPIGHWKDDKLLLDSDDGRLILCDPVTQETRDLGFHSGLWCEGIFVYRESLVSLKDCSQSCQCHDEAQAHAENNRP
ncbi:hypothetical protein RDABS01_038132 [Bienertia sinuspersici]